MRVGDSLVHPEIDGVPIPFADEYAREFISFLQAHPALRNQLPAWISSRTLEHYYREFGYREFGTTIGFWHSCRGAPLRSRLGYFWINGNGKHAS